MSYLVIKPTRGEIQGQIAVPSSKYHLHRALILGSLAEGTTTIYGRSDALHIQDTLNALYDLGAQIEDTDAGYLVTGSTYDPRSDLVRLGSSGSTTQFLLGLGSVASRPVTFDGVEALRNRPIGPLLHALSTLGIRSEAHRQRLPVTVFPGGPSGGRVAIQGILSQWISGLLMVAPFAQNETHIEILDPYNEQTYVRLTKSMLSDFGIQVQEDATGRHLLVSPGQKYRATAISLDADLSSAAFPLVYAALHEGEVTLTQIDGAGTHPEGQILEILKQMGVDISENPTKREVTVRNHGNRPNGIEVDMADIPDLIPILSTLGSLSRGRTILRNIGPGRLKESNRVLAMQQLNKMGARIQENDDDLIIDGVDRLTGTTIDCYDDHRVQMAFAVAGSVADGETLLNFPHAFAISYPAFIDHMTKLGMDILLTHDSQIKELAPSGSKPGTVVYR